MRLEYFEMIDTVASFDAQARTLVARCEVPLDSPVFEGHFPGHPLVPGVLLTETMAQASGYLVLALTEFAHMPFLMAVDKARFRTFVPPGAALEVSAGLDMMGSGYAATKASITCEGKPVCDAQLRFKTMPFPPGMETGMRARARQIGLLPETAR